MTSDDAHPESFAALKNSFYYGSRSDLNFKFLKDLSDEDAARFGHLLELPPPRLDGRYAAETATRGRSGRFRGRT